MKWWVTVSAFALALAACDDGGGDGAGGAGGAQADAATGAGGMGGAGGVGGAGGGGEGGAGGGGEGGQGGGGGVQADAGVGGAGGQGGDRPPRDMGAPEDMDLPEDMGVEEDAEVVPDMAVPDAEVVPDMAMEPAGACDNPEDFDALAAAEATIGDTIGGCVPGCLLEGAECAAMCIGDAVGLTAQCADCFGDIVVCTVMNCALQCIDPNSQGCADCQDQNCFPAFEECAGVAPP